jgi:hypothetical protein
MRLTSTLAALFAMGAAALVVISASTEPQGVQDWLSPPTPHAAAAYRAPPKTNTQQAAPVAASVTPAVTASVATAPAVVLGDAAPPPMQQSGAVSIDTIGPSDQQGYSGITFQPGQYVPVPDAAPGKIEGVGLNRHAVAHADSPVDGAFLTAAAAAAARIDSAVSESGQIAADVATGVQRGVRSITGGMIGTALSEAGQIATRLGVSAERGFRSIAASLMHAIVEMQEAISTRDPAIHQARVDVPAPVAPAVELQSERGQPAPPQPAIASNAEANRAAAIYAMRVERVTAKAAAPRASEMNVDPQHAAVERLNLLSLAAARHGQAWRPNGPRDMAETSLLP